MTDHRNAAESLSPHGFTCCPNPVFVFGVPRSGTTALAQALGISFRDGDDLHPEANKAKMAAGEPLTDADRGPWLAAPRRAWCC
jgi:carbohydrate kinase (thermoresistant glucokinase family)